MSRFGILLLLLSETLFGQAPTLFRNPALSKTHIVFEAAGDLWSVPRAGGTAVRLTAGPGMETRPIFSPDGSLIAFTGEYDGNVDVFVMPSTGGVPKRMTWHPAADTALAWTPDGARILFSSARTAYSRFSELFTVPLSGGPSEKLPLPAGYEGAYSPDGRQLAYVPLSRAFSAWKRYRGGRATPIWIATLENSKIEKVPRAESNDFEPMWAGGRLWFLSDREGRVTLFSYDPKTRQVTRAIDNKGMDYKSASAGPDAIVLEQFGSIQIFDWRSGKVTPVPITVAGDFPELRERWVRVGSRLSGAGISPNGARAVFQARGEILTVPAEKGDARNLTNSPGVMERDPAWSPDGRTIAFFSDEGGEYKLHLVPHDGKGEAVKIPLEDKPTFYGGLKWSPDSKKIAYLDAHLQLWCLDLDSGKPVKVDKEEYGTGFAEMTPAWSPNSKWLAYPKRVSNFLGAIHLYSLETGQAAQITDGMSDASHPVFDQDGKYLYFTASTDSGPALQPDISGVSRTQTRSIYLAVLSKQDPSPFLPESDEEKPAEPKGAEEQKPGDAKADSPKPESPKTAAAKPVEVKIDLDGILQRVLAVPMPARRYVGLQAGKAGTLLAIEAPPQQAAGGPAGLTVHRFDLKQRRADVAVSGVSFFQIAQNGEKILIRQGDRWEIGNLRPLASAGALATQAPAGGGPGAQALKTADLEVKVNPRAEWRQMYYDAWRIQREFFYDPALHGLDLPVMIKRYEPYLDAVLSRADLNYLMADMMGEITVGHLGVGGGDMPEVRRVQTGLLGADYETANGRYRFSRVYSGENWNPQMRAPLTEPGVNISAGEYLLSVEGRNLTAADNLYSFFEGTAGKQTRLTVGPNPTGEGAREVVVVPVASEQGLRNLAWIEENRRKVEQMTNGRVAYVYMPDTSMGGYTAFNRYFFAQIGKEAAIIDERYNAGGMLATDVAEMLTRKHLSSVATRDGADEPQPQGAIFGPKVMIINESAGSGGDAMPWYFRRAGAGKLVGKRTWGGLVGRAGAPQLMDGGSVSAPSSAVWDPSTSKWIAENVGVEPDVEVEYDPELVRLGRDPQLEKAAELVMAELPKQPPPKPKRPAYPNYQTPGGAPGPNTANATRR